MKQRRTLVGGVGFNCVCVCVCVFVSVCVFFSACGSVMFYDVMFCYFLFFLAW